MTEKYCGTSTTDQQYKEQTTGTQSNTHESPNPYAKWKKPNIKDYMLYDSICVTFWNRRNSVDRNQIKGCCERGLGQQIVTEGHIGIFWGERKDSVPLLWLWLRDCTFVKTPHMSYLKEIIFFSSYLLIFERDRERTRRGEAERGGYRGSRGGSVLTAGSRCGIQTHQLWDHDLSQSQRLNWQATQVPQRDTFYWM